MSNEYYDEWLKHGAEKDHLHAKIDNAWADRMLARRRARDTLTKTYAWAVPNDTAIALCVKYSPLVEMGAGTGYWAFLIQQAGGDIIAYDKNPYKNCQAAGKWTEIKKGTPGRLRRAHRDRTLLLCWPPYDEEMATRSVRLHQSQRVIYVGEGSGVCTGSESFHRLLERDFVEIATVTIPQWDYIHDYLVIYERKTRT